MEVLNAPSVPDSGLGFNKCFFYVQHSILSSDDFTARNICSSEVTDHPWLVFSSHLKAENVTN